MLDAMGKGSVKFLQEPVAVRTLILRIAAVLLVL